MPGVAVVQQKTGWVAKSTKAFDVGEKVGTMGGEVSLDYINEAVYELTLQDKDGQSQTLYIKAGNETRCLDAFVCNAEPNHHPPRPTPPDQPRCLHPRKALGVVGASPHERLAE